MPGSPLERPRALDLFFNLFDGPGHFIQQHRTRRLMHNAGIHDTDGMALMGLRVGRENTGRHNESCCNKKEDGQEGMKKRTTDV